MQILRLAALVTSLALVPACNGGAPAPASAPKAPEKVAAPAEPAKVAAAPAATPAATPEHKEGHEEGCIYEDAHKKHGGDDEANCPHGGAADAPAGTGLPGHHGAAFALKETRALSQVLASGKDAIPKDPVQVSGTIDSVCQKKGCWMVIKDGEAQARILMKDHGFTVPMDTKGKSVVVEGTLEARTFTEAQVKHLEKDAGGDPAKASGERTEFVLTASGVQIANS